jgi:hypothetical protein
MNSTTKFFAFINLSFELNPIFSPNKAIAPLSNASFIEYYGVLPILTVLQFEHSHLPPPDAIPHRNFREMRKVKTQII